MIKTENKSNPWAFKKKKKNLHSFLPSEFLESLTCTRFVPTSMETCQMLMLGLDFETDASQEFNYPVGVRGSFGFMPNC